MEIDTQRDTEIDPERETEIDRYIDRDRAIETEI